MKLIGTGSALPKRQVSNDELSQFLDISIPHPERTVTDDLIEALILNDF